MRCSASRGGRERVRANGAIGLTRLAKSAPDGHTSRSPTTNLAIGPHLNSKLPYEPLKDFAPIALLARVPSCWL